MYEQARLFTRSTQRSRIDNIGRTIGLGALLTVVYVLTAEAGFRVAFVAEQVTTVWAPSGLAIAALLLWGVRLSPAVWIGAFAANAGNDAPLWTAAAIATGNTLEAVGAVWGLSRLRRFDPSLLRIRDTLAFMAIAAGLSTIVSATIGSATLCAAAVQPWSQFFELWWEWWLGDATGALLVGPVVLTTVRRGTWLRRRWTEATLLLAVTVLGTQLVFAQAFGDRSTPHPVAYIVFPMVIAAAIRNGQPATALVVFAASVVTVWDTIAGAGPFAGPELRQSLIQLQVFMGVLAGTGLVLAAAMAERETGERRRAAAYAVGEVLAGAPDLPTAAPAILRAICGNLEWQIGAMWVIDPLNDRLRCLTVWNDETQSAAAFIRATTGTTFVRGVGLPGRIWAGNEAAWIEDVVLDPNFPRAPAAREAGVHGGFGFPISVGAEVFGVVECFKRTVVAPDPDMLQTMSTVGNQIGQFVARKREERAVAEEQRRTAAMLERAPDALIVMDHNGMITEFNPAAVRMFGYSRHDAVGRELAALLIPPSLRHQHRQGIARYLLTGEGPFIDQRVETTAWHADGFEFPVEVSITRIPGIDPPVFTGFVRDLTDRVRAEQEREHLLSEAEAANRAKDEFLATLSHELRTPLNAIVGWTRMLLDGALDEASARRALAVIDRNAQLQARLVGDILDVSRIITGGLQLEPEMVELGSIVRLAVDAMHPAADARGVQLHCELPERTTSIRGDAQRLQQVVWNLLSNGVKFTDAGGTVRIRLTDTEPDFVRLQVEDDGEGIDPEFLPHIFERFTQADGSVSRRHGGLGLGLAIVQHLVQLHGGTVYAESPGRGKGSVFTVDLPRAS